MTAAFDVQTTIVDLPTRRPHAFSTSTMNCQSVVIVQLRSDGLTGIGEGVVPGGPWWGGESVETMKVVIDRYLGPSLQHTSSLAPRPAITAMNRVVAGNHFAKSAVEMALWDLTGKRLGCGLADILGGAFHTDIPITWALSGADSGGADASAEAEERVGQGFAAFKLKMGALPIDEDINRVIRVREKLPEAVTVGIDPNGAWDEHTAIRGLRQLAAAGVDIAEQPVPRWNLRGLARLRDELDMIVMADEAAQSGHDMIELLRLDAASAVSIKLPKAAGLLQAAAMADTAIAGGVAVYGGTTLETSIATAASAQLYATWPSMLGCELVGPLLLEDEVVAEPLRYDGGRLDVPTGPGMGVQLDDDKVRFYARDPG